MMRDGRASIHSVVTRNVTISGFQLDNPRQCLGKKKNLKDIDTTKRERVQIYDVEMFYLNTIKLLFLFVEQLEQF